MKYWSNGTKKIGWYIYKQSPNSFAGLRHGHETSGLGAGALQWDAIQRQTCLVSHIRGWARNGGNLLCQRQRGPRVLLGCQVQVGKNAEQVRGINSHHN